MHAYEKRCHLFLNIFYEVILTAFNFYIIRKMVKKQGYVAIVEVGINLT